MPFHSMTPLTSFPCGRNVNWNANIAFLLLFVGVLEKAGFFFWFFSVHPSYDFHKSFNYTYVYLCIPPYDCSSVTSSVVCIYTHSTDEEVCCFVTSGMRLGFSSNLFAFSFQSNY